MPGAKAAFPRSRDLTAAAVMLTAGIVLMVVGDTVARKLSGMMTTGLSISRDRIFDEHAMVRAFSELSTQALYAVAPVLVLTLVAALGAPLALGGWSPQRQVAGAGSVAPGSRVGAAAHAVAAFLGGAGQGAGQVRHRRHRGRHRAVEEHGPADGPGRGAHPRPPLAIPWPCRVRPSLRLPQRWC